MNSNIFTSLSENKIKKKLILFIQNFTIVTVH